MTITLYSVSIPPVVNGLRILSQLLKKGQEHAAAGQVTEDKLAAARLVEDMKPLTYQIQRISDTAKGVAVRLGGVAPVPMADTETNFPEMYERIQKTLTVLETVKPEMVNGKESIEISFGDRKFSGEDYVVKYALPNFYFHLVTAYSLLRMEGVPVGKNDYLILKE